MMQKGLMNMEEKKHKINYNLWILQKDRCTRECYDSLRTNYDENCPIVYDTTLNTIVVGNTPVHLSCYKMCHKNHYYAYKRWVTDDLLEMIFRKHNRDSEQVLQVGDIIELEGNDWYYIDIVGFVKLGKGRAPRSVRISTFHMLHKIKNVFMYLGGTHE